MLIRLYLSIIIPLIILGYSFRSVAQSNTLNDRGLTVADGIPQSYISGIVQDPSGFIWISTRDGLARYDGRKFKTFRNERDNPSSLTSNIIDKLFLDKTGRLWICHEKGDVDVLDTRTQKITRLTTETPFSILKGAFKPGDNIVQDKGGTYWILANTGQLFEVNYPKKLVRKRNLSQLFPSLNETQITGIALHGDSLLLTLDRCMIYVDTQLRLLKRIPYGFDKPHLYHPDRSWKDNSPIIRANGDIIIPDENRLILYQATSQKFKVYQLPEQRYYITPHLLSTTENELLIAYDHFIFRFTEDNLLQQWPADSHTKSVKTALLLDRSGVLWVGTNGYGIRLHDTYLKQMPQLSYHSGFPSVALEMLGVSEEVIRTTFIENMNAYFFRWTNNSRGEIWISKAGRDVVDKPNMLYYHQGKLKKLVFQVSKEDNIPLQGLDALTISPQGRLWALDNHFRLFSFDANTLTAKVHPAIDHGFPTGQLIEINSMTMDGEFTFWISTSVGVFRYNIQNGQVTHILQKYPNLHPLCTLQDPSDDRLLWIGTYSDGLIRFNKEDGTTTFFSQQNGLPNNTVYAIIPWKKAFWCSSNKGIFSFNRKSHQVILYRTQGVKPIEEFNRFHYFLSADGQMGFGASEGYTVFCPEELNEDHFQPEIALTAIKINNKTLDWKAPDSPAKEPINDLTELRLPYYQNFLSFEYAALQFNIPEKLQYRYKLTDIDTGWIVAGNENTATYTTIPPGNYTLFINASNTSGKWSSQIKELHIFIAPPFWQTWWFRLCILLALIGFAFSITQQRIRNIRKKDRHRLAFERETMELEAQALRLQMNPHFIFNCLNSIKALIQEDQGRKAVNYLTTFSKLTRNQLKNDQREVSLKEELDSLKLYLQLEAFRFEDKINYHFDIDPSINLYAIKVPPLLLQPFVENAIIHGIMPLPTEGTIRIRLKRGDNVVICEIDDNGIGRERAALKSLLDKPVHQSKGMLLVQHRLKLHNTLKHRNIGFEVYDKKDKLERAEGTCITFTFHISSADD